MARRADLADGTFTVNVRASRGTSNTAFTASLDAVSVTIAYTVPVAGSAPTYDDDGNMTSDGTYGNRTYSYDTLGRLTLVAGGGATTSYILDGFGNRWSQSTGAVTTSFDLDLLPGNATILSDGTRRYLPGAPGAGFEQGGTWRSALTDLLGSPIEFVDTAGAVSGLTHYDPYGAPRPGSTASVGIGYAGEYRDATGLINLRARSHDPVLARFIGRDTFGGVASAPQTGNRYSYASSNPLRYADPSGHFIQTIIDHPYEALEFALMLNPVGAILVMGYQVITGTDPATGEAIPPEMRVLNVGLIFLGPAAKLVAKGLQGLVKGLGNVFERIGIGAKGGVFAARGAEVAGLLQQGAAAGKAAAGLAERAVGSERALLREGAEGAAGINTSLQTAASGPNRSLAASAVEAKVAEMKAAMTEAELARTTYAAARVTLSDGSKAMWVAGAGRKGDVRTALRGDAINVRSPALGPLATLEHINDAEMHILRAALSKGATIDAIGATRPMCEWCQFRLPSDITIVTELR